MKTPLLTDADLAAIEAAIRDAEKRTTGEIYCVLAAESSDYSATPVAWAAAIALLAPALLLAGGVHVTAPELGPLGGWTASQVEGVGQAAARAALEGTLVLQALLFLATVILVSLRPVRLALTPRGMKRDSVRERARELFISKNLSATRERTGVLIYVSAAEHMAELVADEAIHARVEAAAWDKAMTALTSGLRRGAAAAGFIEAIGLCADLLAANFPAREGDNPNELPDAVVVLSPV
jgi:putative membrane protein